uniref:Uncharacterized protein n=1 Tax=Nymphaea colorata TaxID=210225 RepID=A0A5K1FRN5_9MAGN
MDVSPKPTGVKS